MSWLWAYDCLWKRLYAHACPYDIFLSQCNRSNCSSNSCLANQVCVDADGSDELAVSWQLFVCQSCLYAHIYNALMQCMPFYSLYLCMSKSYLDKLVCLDADGTDELAVSWRLVDRRERKPRPIREGKLLQTDQSQGFLAPFLFQCFPCVQHWP